MFNKKIFRAIASLAHICDISSLIRLNIYSPLADPIFYTLIVKFPHFLVLRVDKFLKQTQNPYVCKDVCAYACHKLYYLSPLDIN